MRTEDTDYPDTCRVCGFTWPAHAPLLIVRDKPGWVTAAYLCDVCGHAWESGWSDRGYDK